jgi:hypothetical protein
MVVELRGQVEGQEKSERRIVFLVVGMGEE